MDTAASRKEQSLAALSSEHSQQGCHASKHSRLPPPPCASGPLWGGPCGACAAPYVGGMSPRGFGVCASACPRTSDPSHSLKRTPVTAISGCWRGRCVRRSPCRIPALCMDCRLCQYPCHYPRPLLVWRFWVGFPTEYGTATTPLIKRAERVALWPWPWGWLPGGPARARQDPCSRRSAICICFPW